MSTREQQVEAGRRVLDRNRKRKAPKVGPQLIAEIYAEIAKES